MYRGIIFDMDGVLADTESYYTNRRDEYLRLMGYQRQENTDFTGSNEKALWETMVPNDPELRQELLMGYRAYRKLHPIPFRELLDPPGSGAVSNTEGAGAENRHCVLLRSQGHRRPGSGGGCGSAGGFSDQRGPV